MKNQRDATDPTPVLFIHPSRALRTLSLLLVLAGVACCVGCVTPIITTLDHAPDPSLRQAEPFPANVVVLPWEDKKPKRDTTDWHVMGLLLPFVPFVSLEFQNGPNVDLSSKPPVASSLGEIEEWKTANPDGSLYAPDKYREVLPLVSRYIGESQVFRDSPVQSEYEIPPTADFAVRGRLNRWASKGWMTCYGLSGAGEILWLLGFPPKRDTWDLDFDLALLDAATGKEVCSRAYSVRKPEPIFAFPWLIAWLYGHFQMRGGDFEAQDLQPFIRSSLEDFTRTVQKSLPPPSDKAYWAEIARKREIRIAKANPPQFGPESASGTSPVGVADATENERSRRHETSAPISPPTSAPASSPISAPASLATQRQSALVIGIGAYANWPSLANAVNDAKAVAEALRTRYGFARVVELYDAVATKEGILESVQSLVEGLSPGDDVAIYFAGHGHFDPTLERGYWVPVDAQREADFLPNSEIHDYIKAMDRKGAGHVLVIADSCFSGAFLDSPPLDARRSTIAPWLNQLRASPSRQALTSGGNEPVADAGKGGHSVFAYYLLQALDQPEYSAFTATELAARVQRLVGSDSDQTPRFSAIKDAGHEGGEFVFVKRP